MTCARNFFITSHFLGLRLQITTSVAVVLFVYVNEGIQAIARVIDALCFLKLWSLTVGIFQSLFCSLSVLLVSEEIKGNRF